MNDTKTKSISETIINIFVGFGINFGLNSLVFPFYGLSFNVISYMEIGALYTAPSLGRQFGLRRLFNKYWRKQPKKGSILEVVLNGGVNYAINFIAGLIFLPLFGIHSSLDIGVISIISTVFTMFRQYLFRRVFNSRGPNYTMANMIKDGITWIKNTLKR